MQDGIDVGAGRPKSGRQSGENGSEDDRRKSIREDSPVKAKVEPHWKAGAMDRTDKTTQPCAEEHPSNSTEQGSENCLREHLSDKAGAGPAKSRANGHLAPPDGGPRH